MKSVIIIYASTGGNTEMTAEFVAGLLEENKIKTVIKRAETCSPEIMKDYDVCILAAPTYGHGLLQEQMMKFCGNLKPGMLKGKLCAAIGLGDPKYEAQYHIESAPVMEKFMTEAGGTIIVPALRISRTPVMHLKGLIPFWTKQLISKL